MAKLPQGYRRLPSGAIGWRVMVNGRAASGSAPTIAEARRARAQAELDLGGTPKASKLTVAELVDVWLAEVQHAGNTIARRSIALAAIPDAFMERQVRDVTPPVVAALWRQMAAAGTGPHTIDKARNCLSAAFKLGAEYGLAASNPIRAAAYSAPTSAKVDPPTAAQVNAIIADVENRPALAAYLRLMATIGARPGELCALQWEHFDRDRSTIAVSASVGRDRVITNGKNGEMGHRTVELDLPTATRLARVPRVVGVPWIFSFNAAPWRPEYPSLEFRRSCERLGFAGIRLYDLRHFAATESIKAGVPITEVAAMLGDRADTVMRVYAHWINAPSRAARAVASALDA